MKKMTMTEQVKANGGLKLPFEKCRELIKVDNLGADIYSIVTVWSDFPQFFS